MHESPATRRFRQKEEREAQKRTKLLEQLDLDEMVGGGKLGGGGGSRRSMLILNKFPTQGEQITGV